MQRYRAAVHVLLSLGARSTEASASRQECGAVCVIGFHNSGTHALVEYVHTFFDVDVYPRMARKKDGILAFDDFILWKHTTPLAPLPLLRRPDVRRCWSPSAT